MSYKYNKIKKRIIEDYHKYDISLDDILDHDIVHDLTFNQAVRLFAELHHMIDGDETYIIIEDEKKSLIEYLK